MTELTLDTLAKRLDRVEREARQWRFVAGVVVVSFASLTLIGASPNPSVPFEVRAQRFVVVNYDNTPLVEIGRVPGFPASLALYDRDRNLRAVLGVSGDDTGDPSLVLNDRTGKERAVLKLWTGQEGFGSDRFKLVTRPSLMLLDENGRATLETWHDGAILSLYGGKDWSESVRLRAHDGSASLSLVGGPRDSDRLKQEEQKWSTTFPGERAKARARSMVNGNAIDMIAGDTTTILTFSDVKNVLRLKLGQTKAEGQPSGSIDPRRSSSMLLFDKDGQLTWRAP